MENKTEVFLATNKILARIEDSLDQHAKLMIELLELVGTIREHISQEAVDENTPRSS